MRFTRIFSAAAITLWLSACASVTQGTTQEVAIETAPAAGAQCEVRNDKGVWVLAASPGVVTVNKSGGGLMVFCQTKDGWKGFTSVGASTSAGFAGNILFGGMIGMATDMASGAAYEYPPKVMVAMLDPETKLVSSAMWPGFIPPMPANPGDEGREPKAAIVPAKAEK